MERQSKYILIACVFIFLLLTFIVVFPKKEPPSINSAEISNSYTVEGYVVSKRIHSIWIAAEPLSLWKRMTGYFTSYGSESIRVLEHKDVEGQGILNGLKTNQKVIVYGDSLKESNPPMINAYYIESIE